jgi:hypothetical protein
VILIPDFEETGDFEQEITSDTESDCDTNSDIVIAAPAETSELNPTAEQVPIVNHAQSLKPRELSGIIAGARTGKTTTLYMLTKELVKKKAYGDVPSLQYSCTKRCRKAIFGFGTGNLSDYAFRSASAS